MSAFVLFAERNEDSSLYRTPVDFDNYMELVTNDVNTPQIFDDGYFDHIFLRVHVPNQPPLPPVPHVAPGTPPQVPPPANNNRAGMDSNDDDDDDESFNGEDDAPCGDSDGGMMKGDECTATSTDPGNAASNATGNVINGFTIRTGPAPILNAHSARTMLTNVSTAQPATVSTQAPLAGAIDFQTLINRQAAAQANNFNILPAVVAGTPGAAPTNYPNALPIVVAGVQTAAQANRLNALPAAGSRTDLDDQEFFDYYSDGISVASWDSHELEVGFEQTHANEEAIPQESEPVNGGDDEPEPSSEQITTLRASNERPNFSLDLLRDSPVASMLPDFLARINAANQELEAERAAGTLANRRIEIDENQNAFENGQYIEMNIGLGVFEERSEVSSSSESETSSRSTGERIMERLLGGKRKRNAEEEEQQEVKKPKIEEL